MSSNLNEVVNRALVAADFSMSDSPDVHHLKVLARAVRRLRAEGEVIVGSRAYQKGWDDATRIYGIEIQRLQRLLAESHARAPMVPMRSNGEIAADVLNSAFDVTDSIDGPQDLPVSPAHTAKKNQELLEVVRAQHNALDILMARLVILTQRHTPAEPFFPSKAGLPWEAMKRGNAAIVQAERAA